MSSLEQLKVLGWRETRPWHEFFAAFKPVELNHHYVTQRVSTNLLHYRSNYLFIAVVVLLIRIIFSPLLMITLCLCVAVWYYSFVIHDRPFVAGDVHIEGSKKAIGCGIVSFILLALTGSITTLMWTLVIIFLVVGLHALFRPRSISSRTNHVYEEAKYSWLGPDTISKKIDSYGEDPENPTNAASAQAEAGGFYAEDSSSVRKRKN